MNLVLSPKQLLSLHDVLSSAQTSCGDDSYETVQELADQVRQKIIESLDAVNEENNKKIFAVWEKKESKRISEMENELDSLRNQVDTFKAKPPSHPGILKRSRTK